MTALEILDAGQPTAQELAERISIRVRMAENHAKKALEYALEIGALLNEAKPLVKHGDWDKWLTEHCNLAARTARAYMKLAKDFPSLPEPERQRVATLPVREAVKAIATDPAPPATEKVLPAAAPRRREERERVSAKFSSTAKSIRDAAKRINLFMDIKPAQVTALRTKLQDMLAELDQLQQGGAE
ncbi:DUF3102 domain-containing protein [uncultured Comamonas sp.]|uniref:DUF3102 domain-containing protein n=1 Tax=uncultured Comamonas sp. TaxID=114710 RepID=UPI00261F906F|nr:DUF3102 domain-containing protein [uncultured Comamonas sp.]